MKKIVILIAIVAVIGACVFGLAACGPNSEGPTVLQFVMPDGTPALAGMNFLNKSVTVANYQVEGTIVAATSIQTQIGGEKADIVIAPTNAGATLIKNGAPYKLAAVSVVGNLYVIGNPEKAGGDNLITFEELKGKRIASIGQNNVPDKVFRYVVENTENISYSDFEVEFVADGAAARVALLRDTNPCDFALLAEPAATAFSTPNGGGFSARLDIQEAYKAINGGDGNFPQASLFVKNSLFEDEAFMSALYLKLEENLNWISANPSSVTTAIQEKGSTSTFPAPSIPRCGITVTKADSESIQADIVAALTIMVPSVDWNSVDLF